MAITTGKNLPASAHQPGAIQEAMRSRAGIGGRPSKYTPEIAAEICERIHDGQSLRSIDRDPAMPRIPTIYDWIDNVPEFAQQYARARQVQATAFVHDGLEILDNADDSSMPQVRKAESRANYRLALAKCYDRDTYGDKVQQDVSVRGVQIHTTVNELADLLNGR